MDQSKVSSQKRIHLLRPFEDESLRILNQIMLR
jgi:hypothetical protein